MLTGIYNFYIVLILTEWQGYSHSNIVRITRNMSTPYHQNTKLPFGSVLRLFKLEKCYLFYKVRCAHNSGGVVNFTAVARSISSVRRWPKNYKNRLRFAKVIVKYRLPRFFVDHCVEILANPETIALYNKAGYVGCSVHWTVNSSVSVGFGTRVTWVWSTSVCWILRLYGAFRGCLVVTFDACLCR